MSLKGKKVKIVKGIGKGKEGTVESDRVSPFTKQRTLVLRHEDGSVSTPYTVDEVKEK